MSIIKIGRIREFTIIERNRRIEKKGRRIKKRGRKNRRIKNKYGGRKKGGGKKIGRIKEIGIRQNLSSSSELIARCSKKY